MDKNPDLLFLLAGGGSGGHLFPGLAVAHALRQKLPAADIHFVTTQRDIDKNIMQNTPFPWHPQPIKPLPTSLGQVVPFLIAWRNSLNLCRQLTKNRKTVTLGLGGFASGPAIHLAKKQKQPSAILNPDALPGRANRFAVNSAQKIFIQWEQSRQYFGPADHKCIATGCPIRQSLTENLDAKRTPDHRAQTCVSFDLDPDKKILLIMAGSQGGATLNRAATKCIVEHLKGWSRKWQIVHLTGPADAAWVADAYKKSPFHAVVWPFTDKMDQLLPITDLALCRAGASTLAELTALAVPSILLPYPYHKDQHQLKNAQILADSRAAFIVIDDADPASTANRLKDPLLNCFSSPDTLFDLTGNLKSLAKPNPADAVAQHLINLT